MKIRVAMMTIVFGLCSCSESPTDSDQGSNNETKKPGKHMLSDQEKMIQKAKDTEKLIKEADEKRRKAMKDQGG